MKLEPFTRVDGVPFDVSPQQLCAARGNPARRGRNEIGLEELDYGNIVFRFQDCGRLEEVTLQATVLHLGSVAIPFASLAWFLRESDPGLFERAGFLVSPKFGIAFDPRAPSWITALAAHCIEEWRAL